jgi:hypothetical protein
MDQDIDKVVANEAIRNSSLRGKKVGCDEMDQYVDVVFRQWENDPTHIHTNLGVVRSCKGEARAMIKEATKLLNQNRAMERMETDVMLDIIENRTLDEMGLQ